MEKYHNYKMVLRTRNFVMRNNIYYSNFDVCVLNRFSNKVIEKMGVYNLTTNSLELNVASLMFWISKKASFEYSFSRVMTEFSIF